MFFWKMQTTFAAAKVMVYPFGYAMKRESGANPEQYPLLCAP